MEFIFFFISSFISFISCQYRPSPILDNYFKANNLLDFLFNDPRNRPFYFPNTCVFFQSDWYISPEESLRVIDIMDNIYKKYRLSGVFLVLDNRVPIGDLGGYAAELEEGLERKNIFKKENVYSVVLYYTYPPVGGLIIGQPWKLDIAIGVGGKNAEHYFSKTSRETLRTKWGPILRYYTYDNIDRFLSEIENAMDFQNGWDRLPTWAKVAIIVGIVVLVIVAAVLAIIFRKQCGCCCCLLCLTATAAAASGNDPSHREKTTDYGGGVKITTGTYY